MEKEVLEIEEDVVVDVLNVHIAKKPGHTQER